MQTYHNPAFAGNGESACASTLPLWRWAAAKAAPAPTITTSRAVLRIAAKGRVSIAHAAIIAGLMGFNQEASQ